MHDSKLFKRSFVVGEKLLLLKILNDCNYQMTVLDLKVNDFVLRKNIDEFQLLLVMDAKCNDHEIILKKVRLNIKINYFKRKICVRECVN